VGQEGILERAHAEIVRHSDIQFSFPRFEAPQTPDWLKGLATFLRAHWTEIRWGLGLIAAALVLWAIYSLARQYWPLLRWRRRPEQPVAPATEPAWRPSVAAARRLLDEADALARERRYAEAVHLLLLRSVEDIEERRPKAVRRAFTSREIAGLATLPDAARPAFRGIAQTVERARFAEKAVGAADFARCRQDYEAFAFAPLWSAA